MELKVKTCAVIVALEEYAALGGDWTLNSSGKQAEEFARWLISPEGLGVPVKNIRVFVNGGAVERFKALGFAQQQIGRPISSDLNPFFAALGKQFPENATDLLIYWVGHGVVGPGNVRRLILADASPELKTNLDIDQLANVLRSHAAESLQTQFAFFDACGQFFESLQDMSKLPGGGLNEDASQRDDIQQYFYFAASSGQYASTGLFGPEVLKVLQILQEKHGEWPPNPRALRNEVEVVFDHLLAENRELRQQPVWLEYTASSGDRSSRGVLPTMVDIHEAAIRAELPLYQLRNLTELAAACQALAQQSTRDALVRELHLPDAIYRPPKSERGLQLDLMRIVAGAIEQDGAEQLAAAVIQMDGNSDAAVRFRNATRKVDALKRFWPKLAAVKLPLERARMLYRASYRFNPQQTTAPSSVEEMVATLMDLQGEGRLVEFLLHGARERPGDPACAALERELREYAPWADEIARAEARLKEEEKSRKYLLAEVGWRAGSQELRITDAWIYSSSSKEHKFKPLAEEGDLAHDLAMLLGEALDLQGGEASITVELLVPEELFYLQPGIMEYKSRGMRKDLEKHYPIALRWLNRMRAAPRDLSYNKGLWRSAAKKIEKKSAESQLRAAWFGLMDDPTTFCESFKREPDSEFIGFSYYPEGMARETLVGIVSEAGLPYACWHRHSGVDPVIAQENVDRAVLGFRELPEQFFKFRSKADLMLLWDDPKRNPYEEQMSEPK